MSMALPVSLAAENWDGGAAARARLWSSALALAMGVHVAGILGMALFKSAPVNDMPAGVFTLELAAFGGNPQATPGGAVRTPPPAPAPKVEEAPKPKPVVRKAEVALPQPKPKKPKPAPAKPAPQPAAASAAPSAGASSQAAAAPSQMAGGGGGVVSGRLGGGGSGKGTPLGRYKVLVFQALWAHRRYPPVAQRMGYQGDVEIEFTVDSNGEILARKLLSGSGFPVLDREGDAILRRVRHFPPFPQDLRFNTLTFRVAIPFQLT